MLTTKSITIVGSTGEVTISHVDINIVSIKVIDSLHDVIDNSHRTITDVATSRKAAINILAMINYSEDGAGQFVSDIAMVMDALDNVRLRGNR